jgi:lysozyme family protein
MADFYKAFETSLLAQSGFIGDPDNDEEEVYRGISRRFHPSWDGWQIIDALRLSASNHNEFCKTLKQNQKLKEKVRVFFKQMYWDRFWGDRVPDQRIAEELFETSTEMGVHRAVGCLQEGLNILCSGQENYRHIIEDGLFGPETLMALKAYLKVNDAPYLLKVMNILQGMEYIERIRRNPNQEAYVRDWFKRIRISRESAGKGPAPPTNLTID